MKTTSTLISLLMNCFKFRLPSAKRTIPNFLLALLVIAGYSQLSFMRLILQVPIFLMNALEQISSWLHTMKFGVVTLHGSTSTFSTANDCGLSNLSFESLTLDTVITLGHSRKSFISHYL